MYDFAKKSYKRSKNIIFTVKQKYKTCKRSLRDPLARAKVIPKTKSTDFCEQKIASNARPSGNRKAIV